jgi:hypothetical protein
VVRSSVRLLLFLLAFGVAAAAARQNNPDGSISTRCVIGLAGVKHNAEGGLRAKNGQLEFHTGKSDASIPASSIEAMFVGTEFTQNGGKELAGNKSNVPNGDDAASSAFVHSRVDMLTVVYRDSSGGVHAAVFALPKNYGDGMLAALIAQGGHVGGAEKSVPSAVVASSLKGNQRTKLSAAATIVVEPVSPGVTKIPAEFRMAIYEDLLEQLRESGMFRQVYRSGDREAMKNSELLTLRATVAEFNEGSERTRELTYYPFGRTKIAVDVQVLSGDGNVLVNQKVTGRVLAVVENLEASHFVAENIRRQLSRNF